MMRPTHGSVNLEAETVTLADVTQLARNALDTLGIPDTAKVTSLSLYSSNVTGNQVVSLSWQMPAEEYGKADADETAGEICGYEWTEPGSSLHHCCLGEGHVSRWAHRRHYCHCGNTYE